MKTKLFFLFLSFFSLWAQNEEDGSLGLGLALGFDVFTERTFPTGSLFIQGMSQGYDIRTEWQIFTNFFYQENFWKNRPFFEDLYPYSFGRLWVDYQLLRYKILQWQVGYLVGHQGFLYPTWEKAVYQIQLGLGSSILFYFGDFFLWETKLTLPFGIYQSRHRQIFLGEVMGILYWQPQGSIEKVDKQSYLLGMGFSYNYILLKKENQTFEQNQIKPFIEVAFFY